MKRRTFPQVTDPASGAVTWTAVAAGDALTCGITSASELLCWGHSRSGQLGRGAFGTYPTPGPVADPAVGPVTWLGVDVGGGHACAVTTEHVAFCWGSNTGGEIGDGTAGSNYSRDIPTRIVQ